MGNRHGDQQLAFVLALVAVSLNLPVVFYGLPVGKSVVGALQILEGRVPYRDFWTMYAPGQFYLTALVFELFGREIVFQGVVAALIRGTIAAILFMLARRLGLSRLLAAALTLLLSAGMLTNPYVEWAGLEISSYDTAILLLLISVGLVVRYVTDGGRRSLVWAGVMAGLAACFKHDVAAYMVAAIVTGLFASWFVCGGRRPAAWMPPIRATANLLLGSFLILIPAAAWLALVAGGDAWQDLIVFPATTFRQTMHEPYPPFLPEADTWRQLLEPKGSGWAYRHELATIGRWALSQLPQYAFVLALGIAIARRRDVPPGMLAITFMSASGIALFWVAAHTQRNTHLFSMAMMSGLWAAASWTWIRQNSGRWTVAFVAILTSGYALALLVGALITIYRPVILWSDSRSLDLPGVRWIRVPSWQYASYYPTAAYLREHTEEGETIYVGPGRHDRLMSGLQFYIVADRLSCCRYSEHHVGVTDRPSVQREIISDLQSNETRALVILEPSDAPPPTELDRYIADNYSPRLSRGRHAVMWLEDEVSARANRDLPLEN